MILAYNLFLQAFDAVATYLGWERFGEANPLMRYGFATIGVVPTLAIAKVQASVLLLVLWHMEFRRMLNLIAGVYSFTALAWLAAGVSVWSAL